MERIVLRSVARELTEAELTQTSGGFDISGGLTGGQETSKGSSPDPNGPRDKDQSAADWD